MLSKRLKVIYDFIDENESIINIGTDHALLEIELTKNKNVFCIGTDINNYSIQKSLRNIEKNNLKNKIFLIQSDGLNNVDVNGEVLVLSGLGTSTILKILKNKKSLNASKIIIQTNNHLNLLRKKMNEFGYIIKDEKAVFENGYWYVVIVFIKGEKTYLEEEYHLGIYIKDRNYYKHLLFKYKETLNYVMQTVQRISKHYTQNCGFDGVNILNANNKSAEQSVFHLHFHIIPRKDNDNLHTFPTNKKQNVDFKEVLNKLKI